MKLSGIEVSQDVYNANPQLANLAEVKAQPASKYHNTRTEARGLRFASGHEAAGVSQLVMLDEKHQGIYGLRLQVRFPLPGGNVYVADATYLELKDGKLTPVVTDFKGVRTKEYLVKRRAFKAEYGLEIMEL